MNRTENVRPAIVTIFLVIATLIASSSVAGARMPPDITEIGDGASIKLTVELFHEVFNDHKVIAAEKLVAGDATIHTPRGTFTGPGGLLDYLASLTATYPDASFDVTSIDSDGDAIVVQWTMSATQLNLSHEQATAQVSSPGETTITIVDGRVAALVHAERGLAVQPPEAAVAQA